MCLGNIACFSFVHEFNLHDEAYRYATLMAAKITQNTTNNWNNPNAGVHYTPPMGYDSLEGCANVTGKVYHPIGVQIIPFRRSGAVSPVTFSLTETIIVIVIV